MILVCSALFDETRDLWKCSISLTTQGKNQFVFKLVKILKQRQYKKGRNLVIVISYLLRKGVLHCVKERKDTHIRNRKQLVNL